VATFQKRGVGETMSNEEIRVEALEAELKVTFDNMMRYMMFIRDNGYTTEYMKYAKTKGYE
tara:strand:- start:3 stop:185 length:183 start_codon:yes stop_codon:yes gene_type:complete